MTSPYYDAPVDATPVYWVAAIVAGYITLALLWPLFGRLWGRWGGALVRLANTEVPIPPAVVSAAGGAACAVARLVRRVVSAARWCVNPAAERRRRLGRYLASLPPHSGLTVYEEYEAEINALPPGAARLALRRNLARTMPRPTAAEVARARARRGRSRVPEGLVRCLLRGDVPRAPRYAAMVESL